MKTNMRTKIVDHSSSLRRSQKSKPSSQIHQPPEIPELSMVGGSDDYMQYELNDWVQRRSFEHPEWFESKSVTKQGGQSAVQQMTSRAKHEEKTTGSYERFTAKQSMSSGHQVVERSGRVGFKDVQQKSATLRIGDKSGYTGYYSEQKVQRVNYDKNSYNSGNTSRSKNKY